MQRNIIYILLILFCQCTSTIRKDIKWIAITDIYEECDINSYDIEFDEFYFVDENTLILSGFKGIGTPSRTGIIFISKDLGKTYHKIEFVNENIYFISVSKDYCLIETEKTDNQRNAYLLNNSNLKYEKIGEYDGAIFSYGVHGVSFPAAMFKLQVMHIAVARSLQGRHNLLCRQNGRGVGVARLGRIAAARHLGDDFQRDGVQMQLHLGAALVLANLGFPEAVVKLHVVDDGESQLAQLLNHLGDARQARADVGARESQEFTCGIVEQQVVAHAFLGEGLGCPVAMLAVKVFHAVKAVGLHGLQGFGRRQGKGRAGCQREGGGGGGDEFLGFGHLLAPFRCG